VRFSSEVAISPLASSCQQRVLGSVMALVVQDGLHVT
jgi:hypothetical protein